MSDDEGAFAIAGLIVGLHLDRFRAFFFTSPAWVTIIIGPFQRDRNMYKIAAFMVFGLNVLHAQQRELVIAWAPAEKDSLGETLKKAAVKAAGGGIAGAGAMAINVCTLMWMRTTVNFQYRYGMGTFEAIQHLYNDGGRGLGQQGAGSHLRAEDGPHLCGQTGRIDGGVRVVGDGEEGDVAGPAVELGRRRYGRQRCGG